MPRPTSQHFGHVALAIALLLLRAGPASGEATSGSTANRQSAGCGAVQSGTGTFFLRAIRVLDRERVFYVRVPAKYDPKRAYPVIFRWHGSGGNGLSGGLGIEFSAADDAIVVGADGLHWDWSEGSADLAFFDRMLDVMEKKYCIDRHRVFS